MMRHVLTNIRPRGRKTMTGRFCESGHVKHDSKPRRTAEDAFLTITDDLHAVRRSLLDRESRRVTLGHVDTLLDNIENYMAEN